MSSKRCFADLCAIGVLCALTLSAYGYGLRQLCTVNGVLCEVAHGYGMKMLEALRKAQGSPPRPVSEGEKPNLTVVS